MDQRTPKPPWPAKADLAVRTFRQEVIKQSTLDYSLPPTVIREYRLHVMVINIGKGQAGPFKVPLEKKPQSYHASGATYEIVTQLKCDGLMPGKGSLLTAPGTFQDIDGGLDPQWWCFKATADSENEVQETNEANNILIQTNCKQS
ncbi:MAG: CARDB domain-containing protein [Acidobacteriota bacterium]|nr:CARDB domain-containing protein [Acidobacteriota bacterium]